MKPSAIKRFLLVYQKQTQLTYQH